MKSYGQFCPVAKTAEFISEKWTLLILRELLLGTTRFNDFQRAMSRISPTLLTKRLRQLEQHGIILRKKLTGQKGSEYRLTAAGKELSPIIEVLAVWGMRWARRQLSDDELDVEFLMRELQRRIHTDQLPDGETIICLLFDEMPKHKSWWLIINGDVVDLCTEDPGRNVDLYITADIRTLVNVWQGNLDIYTALNNQSIKAHGVRHLINTMPNWFGVCLYKDIKPGDPALLKQLAK